MSELAFHEKLINFWKPLIRLSAWECWRRVKSMPRKKVGLNPAGSLYQVKPFNLSVFKVPHICCFYCNRLTHCDPPLLLSTKVASYPSPRRRALLWIHSHKLIYMYTCNIKNHFYHLKKKWPWISAKLQRPLWLGVHLCHTSFQGHHEFN